MALAMSSILHDDFASFTIKQGYRFGAILACGQSFLQISAGVQPKSIMTMKWLPKGMHRVPPVSRTKRAFCKKKDGPWAY